MENSFKIPVRWINSVLLIVVAGFLVFFGVELVRRFCLTCVSVENVRLKHYVSLVWAIIFTHALWVVAILTAITAVTTFLKRSPLGGLIGGVIFSLLLHVLAVYVLLTVLLLVDSVYAGGLRGGPALIGFLIGCLICSCIWALINGARWGLMKDFKKVKEENEVQDQPAS
jgi:hypothetical protein